MDNDSDACEMITAFLTIYDHRFQVTVASDPAAALRAIEIATFDIYIFDNWLPRKNGVEFCAELRGKGDRTPIIIYSGVSDPTSIVRSYAAGANEYLVKPAGLLSLGPTIDKLLKNADVMAVS